MIQTRAEALHKRDRARVELAGLAALLRGGLVVTRELLGVEARERSEHLGLGRREQRALARAGAERRPPLPSCHRRTYPASSRTRARSRANVLGNRALRVRSGADAA